MTRRLAAVIVLLWTVVGRAEDPPASIESLVEELATSDPRARQAIAERLAARGEEAVPHILKGFEAEDFATYSGAAGAIIALPMPPDAALPLLDGELRSSDPSRVRVAVMVLAAYGPRAADRVPRLVEILDHPNFHVRSAACDTLGAIGPKANGAVPNLLVQLREDVASVRGHAALALGEIGVVEGHDVVGALVERTRDVSALVVERVVRALGSLGEAAAPALPRLREIAAGSSTHRVTATLAAWRVGEDANATVRRLVELCDDFDLNLEAIRSLGEMEDKAAAATPRLVRLLEAEDPDVRLEAVHALTRIAPTASRTRLESVAENDADERVRTAARDALAIEPE